MILVQSYEFLRETNESYCVEWIFFAPYQSFSYFTKEFLSSSELNSSLTFFQILIKREIP